MKMSKCSKYFVALHLSAINRLEKPIVSRLGDCSLVPGPIFYCNMKFDMGILIASKESSKESLQILKEMNINIQGNRDLVRLFC